MLLPRKEHPFGGGLLHDLIAAGAGTGLMSSAGPEGDAAAGLQDDDRRLPTVAAPLVLMPRQVRGLFAELVVVGRIVAVADLQIAGILRGQPELDRPEGVGLAHHLFLVAGPIDRLLERRLPRR